MIRVRENIEKWLLERSRAESVMPVMRTGYRDFYLDFTPQQLGPLHPVLCMADGRSISCNFNWWGDTALTVRHVYSRRLAQTPFALHYLIIGVNPVKIIDFYEPDRPKRLIRLFLFESEHFPAELTVSFENQDDVKFSVPDSLNLSASGEIENGKNGFIVNPDRSQENMFALVLYEPGHTGEKLDISVDIYPCLTRQDALCREHNPARKTVIGNKSDQDILESLWFSQTLISPDWNIDSGHPDLVRLAPWVCELSGQIGKATLLEPLTGALSEQTRIGAPGLKPRTEYVLHKLTDRKIGRLTATEDPFTSVCNFIKKPRTKPDNLEFKEMVFAACFSELIPEKLIIDRINGWWQQYVQPVFSLKLHSECIDNYEMVLCIILFAYRYQLPWAADLADIWRSKKQEPLLEMLLHLRQNVRMRRVGDSELVIEPAQRWSHNIKSIISEESEIKLIYTRFGKKVFTNFQTNLSEAVRIDRQVAICADLLQKKISLVPSLPGGKLNNMNLVKFQAAGYELSVPFVWPKFEFSFAGIRFRVLSKKDRFQITAVQKGDTNVFTCAGEPHQVEEGSRIVFYYYPADGQLSTEIAILPAGIDRKSIHVYGWATNRYGVLVENLYYSCTKQKHAFHTDPSGGFSLSISINKGIELIKIGFRHHETEREIPSVRDTEIQRLLAIRPDKPRNRVLLWIDPDSARKTGELLTEFYDRFSFYPDYIVSEKIPDSISVHDVLIRCKNMRSQLVNSSIRFNLNTKNVPEGWDKFMHYIKSCII